MTTLERPLLLLGDCLDRLKELPDCSVDSVVTDPPYGLSFMGKRWDYDVPSVDVWTECLRVLKPGGHLLAFAGTRTQHRMAVRIEDAGFEIRDMIAWVYGSGFPKSLDVSKAIDKAAGAEREVVGSRVADDIRGGNMHAANRGERHVIDITAPATDAARQWQGWGTALKPALEPITVARKPLIGTVAANVLEHGTGAINVDGCRVEAVGYTNGGQNRSVAFGINGLTDKQPRCDGSLGRWPANFIHDGSEEVTDLLGSAARFFYSAKASKRDRNEGLDGFEVKETQGGGGRPLENYGDDEESQRLKKAASAYGAIKAARANHHPTVKPTDLMRYLCRLVTPSEGIVLDPFTGSGSTGKAAILEGFQFIGIERDEEYMKIAEARIAVAIESRKELLI